MHCIYQRLKLEEQGPLGLSQGRRGPSRRIIYIFWTEMLGWPAGLCPLPTATSFKYQLVHNNIFILMSNKVTPMCSTCWNSFLSYTYSLLLLRFPSSPICQFQDRNWLDERSHFQETERSKSMKNWIRTLTREVPDSVDKQASPVSKFATNYFHSKHVSLISTCKMSGY